MITKLRVKDLEIIEQLPNAVSIRELSRQLKLDAQNLTKRLAYIEQILDKKIIDRSVTGYVLNQRGEEVVSYATESLKLLRKMERQQNTHQANRLRISGRGYLVEHFAAYCYEPITNEHKDLRFDFMDTSPELVERQGRKGILDLILSHDDVLLGENWQSVRIGDIHWNFYANRSNPIFRKRKLDDLQGREITSFCYIENEKLIARKSPFQDKFNALQSSGAQNTRYSIRIILNSDAMAFLPDLSVKEWVEYGELRKVNLNESDARPLTLHINMDTVTNKQKNAIISHLKKSL